MPYPVGSVLGKITTGGKYKLATSGGTDGAQTAVAVLIHAVDATLADARGIVVARGPAIISRAELAYDASVNDSAKIFLLVPQVKLRKRLDLARDAERAQAAIPSSILRNWVEDRL